MEAGKRGVAMGCHGVAVSVPAVAGESAWVEDALPGAREMVADAPRGTAAVGRPPAWGTVWEAETEPLVWVGGRGQLRGWGFPLWEREEIVWAAVRCRWSPAPRTPRWRACSSRWSG